MLKSPLVTGPGEGELTGEESVCIRMFNDDYLKSYRRKQEKQKPHQQYTDLEDVG